MLEPPVTVLAFQKLWLLRVAKEENHKKIQFFFFGKSWENRTMRKFSQRSFI